jgi:hypothetical protein
MAAGVEKPCVYASVKQVCHAKAHMLRVSGILLAMLQDLGELKVVESPLLVDGRTAEHLLHLLLGQAVSHGGKKLSQSAGDVRYM